MDCNSEAAVGGSDPRRTSGDPNFTVAQEERPRPPSVGQAAGGCAGPAPGMTTPVAVADVAAAQEQTAAGPRRPLGNAGVRAWTRCDAAGGDGIAANPQNERQRKRYAEDPDYRAAVLARNRAFRAAHRDEINARAREVYAADDGYRARKRRSGNKWYKPERRLAQVYGLSQQDYDAMLAHQGGVCAICEKRSDKPLFVDHCHVTGKVRGLLCRNCNSALGFMCDDPRLTTIATEYLRRAAARHDGPLGERTARHTRVVERTRSTPRPGDRETKPAENDPLTAGDRP
jgi:recombination endonuclease VII